MATYKDIQRATGLSLATISKFYNGGNVLAANAAAIEKAAAQLEFRPNAFARNLRTRRSRTVGVLLPSLESEFYLSILAGVESRLRQHGVSMLISADHAAEEGGEDAVGVLADRMVDGIITVPTARATPGLVALADRGTPIVVIDWTTPGLDADAVIIDNEGAAATAVQRLADRGHTRVAYIRGEALPTMMAREQGFRRQLRARDIPLPEEYVVSCPMTVAGGRAAMQKLLLLEQRPTAVFCGSNMLGVGALTAISESGLRVPRDMSFVGFDMTSLSRIMNPALDMIAQDVDAISRSAADLMLARLERGADPKAPRRTVVVPVDYVAGGSVADLRPPAD
ncbi:LacI family DNA-binding transcriptional regulator [Microbacterium hibisci]|uniref:LacI family DNA-binding transcriptional regulator n=1 Tax=Microbacterium hibisci TaxID=2036000 RepID=UPI001943BD5F|nr:LacI family DNA-binding transcriptional regulator [Microbacterium hibisci]